MTAELRTALREIVDLRKRLAAAERRIAHLEADKKRALTRAQKATDDARYWHGVALRLAPGLAGKKRAA